MRLPVNGNTCFSSLNEKKGLRVTKCDLLNTSYTLASFASARSKEQHPKQSGPEKGAPILINTRHFIWSILFALHTLP